MSTVREAIERLQEMKPDEHVAVAIWSVEDVLMHAKDYAYVRITPEQAQEIIDGIDRKQDASEGINWDTIGCWLEDLVADGKAQRFEPAIEEEGD